MPHGSIDTEVSRKRLEQLQANLRDKSWQAALIMQPRDLYYYAGTAQPANLWVPDEGDPIPLRVESTSLPRKRPGSSAL